MARNSRNTSVEELNESGVQTDAQEQTSEGTAKRAPRPTIDTSGVTVGGEVDLPGLGQRASKLDTDPVAVAVRDAAEGKWNLLENATEGVKSIATRAAARHGKGINFDTRSMAEGKLYFKTGPKRKTTRSKGTSIDESTAPADVKDIASNQIDEAVRNAE